MKESEKKKYIRWYRIAQKTINDEAIIPDLTDGKITKLVSKKDWLIFALPSEGKKEDAYNRDEPNIYMQLEENKVVIGLVFNTIKSVDKAKNILTSFHQKERDELEKNLKNLDDEYETILNIKTKEYNRRQSPKYTPVMKITTNKLDENFIIKMFEQVVQIRKEGKEKAKYARMENRFYFEGPIINLARIEIKSDENEFKKRILELRDIFLICSSVKTDSKIRKLTKIENQIAELQNQQNNLEKMLSNGSIAVRNYADKELIKVAIKLEKLKLKSKLNK